MREIVAKKPSSNRSRDHFQTIIFLPMAPTDENYALAATTQSGKFGYGIGRSGNPGDPGSRGAADIAFVAEILPGLDGLGASGRGAHAPRRNDQHEAIPRFDQKKYNFTVPIDPIS